VLRRLAALDYGGAEGAMSVLPTMRPSFADFNRSNIYGAGFWSVTKLSSIDVISKDKLTQVPSRVLKEKSGPPQAQINA
jgi:hypothetical protein